MAVLPRSGITKVPETVGPEAGPLATTSPPTDTFHVAELSVPVNENGTMLPGPT
jgi:hypothetical protein